ncbi:MAG: TIGR04255 family protein [Polyangiaceae bacterium]|nr:TIGR04255 family protein [Polyangiaceae bacterium]
MVDPNALDDIVSFERPPVVEVVCGVQFGPLPLQTAHFGKFWCEVREDFPVTRDMPPLSPLLEPAPGAPPSSTVLWSTLPELRRVFLVNSDRGRLLQLQADRFHFNWQKVPDGEDYPRYREVAAQFQHNWARFVDFVRSEPLPDPQVVQAELTYVNVLSIEGDWSVRALMAYYPWLSHANPAVAAQPEVELALHYEVPEITGRLHVNIRSGRRPQSNERVVVMELTTRGRATGSDLEAWFGEARSKIVRSFTGLTSPEAHERWGRTQ